MSPEYRHNIDINCENHGQHNLTCAMLFPEFVPTRTSESSGHQITSPDSCWGNEEPEKITQLSQSSETNAVSKVGPEDAVEYQNLHSSCHVCKKKPTSVILKVNFNLDLEYILLELWWIC